MNINEENKNYQQLVEQAEGAFLKKEFLEAFLIQSCVIEGVLKNFVKHSLKTLIQESSLFANKIENFEFSRSVDDLYASRKIDVYLYENLNKYRKKRNDVIHRLLEYQNENQLNKELKEAYEVGRNMKGFIVDTMTKEQHGLTVAETNAIIDNLLSQVTELQKQLVELGGPDLIVQFQKILKEKTIKNNR